MAILVIVHGISDGGWAWTPIARLLRQAGHEVLTPTLTGCGERVHLATRQTNLSTWILDVANVFRYEKLEHVTLVGCSLGGLVITGVAEQVPELIDHLIYLDASVPQDGQSVADIVGPELTAGTQKAAEQRGEGWYVPANPSKDRRTPQYVATIMEPLAVRNPAAARLKRTYVRFTAKKDSPTNQVIDRTAERIRQEPGWTYLERPYVHYPCLDQEGGVELMAELLAELAG